MKEQMMPSFFFTLIGPLSQFYLSIFFTDSTVSANKENIPHISIFFSQVHSQTGIRCVG